MRFIKHPAVKIFITLALFALIAWKVDFAEAGRRLLSLPLHIVLAAIGITFFALLVQAYKTQILLRDMTIAAILRVGIISQVYSMVLFGQIGGDIAKAGYLVRSPSELHRVVAAVLFDRVTGFVGLLILGVTGLLLEGGHFDKAVAPTLLFCMAVLVGALCAMVGMKEAAAELLFRRLPGPIARHLHNTAQALRGLSSSAWTLPASLVIGIAFQAVVIVNCAWLGAALGIALPLSAWAVVICVMSLVLLLPISIGGIGLRDVTLVGLLASYDVPTDLALAMALALLGLQLVMVVVGGLLMLLPSRVVVR